ncbi:Small-conductance mechanosensitive channel [Thermomonospora echinospora]|uniref:Small-conductance mechanosensitive channel n=1 Tax=Thermomonospora echinospora TaxID=1992 RepID=A0A1H6D698_9ACTN|nr:mechanosensitive ion channel family protein [Thermomonospora echinospora]SEG80889.1 Small-conductance mechanosensitive channel [Thermomonospora echinospora]
MPDPVEWGRVLAGVIVVASALLVGIVLRTLLRRLTERAEDTRWAWDDLLVRLLRDLAVVLTTTAGLWAAVLTVRFQPGTREVIASVLIAVIIMAVTLASARLAAGIVTSVALARSGVAQSVTIFANITRTVVLVVGTLVLLQSMGVSITPMLTALGVGGLAVALALQDTLANLFAGVHILASKTVEPGDFVRLSSGEEGNIVDINWRNTTIRTMSDNLVVVPNARFADVILTNFHGPEQEMGILIAAKVAYDSDLEQVEKVTIEVGSEVMTEVEGGVPEYQPLVRFHTFGESGIDFTVILRTREFNDQFVVKHEFVKRLHARFRAEGIRIPLPTRNLVFAEGRDAVPLPAHPVP